MSDILGPPSDAYELPGSTKANCKNSENAHNHSLLDTSIQQTTVFYPVCARWSIVIFVCWVLEIVVYLCTVRLYVVTGCNIISVMRDVIEPSVGVCTVMCEVWARDGLTFVWRREMMVLCMRVDAIWCWMILCVRVDAGWWTVMCVKNAVSKMCMRR